MYITDPMTGREVFIPWDHLQQACQEIMRLPDYISEAELGKPHFHNDPTYHMRKK